VSRLRAAARWLTRVELPLLALLFCGGAAFGRVLPVALAVAAGFWFLRWFAYGRLTRRTPADWPLGLLILTLPVTLWATALPDVTQPQIYRLLAGVALYYAIINWTTSPGLLRLVAAGLVAAGLLLALSAPVSVAWIGDAKLRFIPEAIYQRLPLLLSDAIHPNVMGGALAILLPVPAARLLFDWRALRWYERILAVLAGLAMLAVLMLTKSRGGLLGLGVALVVLVALRWRRGWLLAPVGALAAAVATWRIGGQRVVETLTASGSLGGLDGRLEVWSRAIFMAEDFPFTGIGLGTFRQVANAMYPFFLAGPDADVPHAHNLFLQVAVDLGLPGLVAWLALFLLVCASAWRIYRGGLVINRLKPASVTVSPCHHVTVSPCPYLPGLAAGLLCSQIALAVHGALDTVTWGTRPALIVWALWGITMAAQHLQTHPAEVDESAVSG
jgi:putative inorganic carbon (HCO3(-)) transporter